MIAAMYWAWMGFSVSVKLFFLAILSRTVKYRRSEIPDAPRSARLCNLNGMKANGHEFSYVPALPRYVSLANLT